MHDKLNARIGSHSADRLSDLPPPARFPVRGKRIDQNSQSVPVLPSEPKPAKQNFPPSVGVSLDTAKDVRAHKDHDQAEESNHLYPPEELEELPVTYGPAGRIVQRLGLSAYILFFIFPLLYVAIFFAIIPLGNPLNHTFKEQAVFLLVSNACFMLAISYLYNAAFLALANCARPFRTSVIPLVVVVIGEIAVTAPVLLVSGVIRFFGVLALAVCYIFLFLSMYFAYHDMRNLVHSFFRRFMTLLVLYIPLLSLFVIAYRESKNAELQATISFFFNFLTFVYRRIMLSRLDPFPLDESQLFAGFWVQNLGDCAQILAFPQVQKPAVFIAIFIANSFANIAFLGFVSNAWIYKIRPVLKTYVKNAFKCNFPIPPIPEADESFDSINRGHDNNVGGYRRRQFRFFFYRLLSQAVAMVMYLGISPILRFGLNKEYTPLNYYSYEQYRNSMIYAGANLVFIALVAFFGYFLLSRNHPETFNEIREIHQHDLVHHTKVGMVTAIITHNLFLTIAIVLSHYCIFAAFLNEECTYKCFLQETNLNTTQVGQPSTC